MSSSRTSNRPSYLVIVLGAVLLSLALAAAAQSSSNEQLPSGSAKEKAETACLTCHEARIIVQQRLTKAAWTKEVDKMIKWGADVDPKDHDLLVDYFSSALPADQAAYEAPKTMVESKAKTKAKR